MEVHPGQVRKGWELGTSARAEVESASDHVHAAKGTDLGDLQATLTAAGRDMGGVLEVTRGVLDEFDTSIEACLETYERTDGRADGRFHGFD